MPDITRDLILIAQKIELFNLEYEKRTYIQISDFISEIEQEGQKFKGQYHNRRCSVTLPITDIFVQDDGEISIFFDVDTKFS